ncbi:MAG: hypothetical protein ACRDKJ_11280 [Actinomycetota bacterium]
MQQTLTHDGSVRRKRRRLAALAAGVATIFIGIAIAFFLTNQTFGNNSVTGGSLVVSQTGLPLDFGGDKVYPTSKDNPTYIVDDTFSLNNDNDVAISYLLTANCFNCSTDSSVQAQFDNLYARISPQVAGLGSTVVYGQPVYTGKLGGLQQRNIGSFDPDEVTAYRFELWLADDGTQQAQNVTNVFDLVVGARTPPLPSSPLPTPTPAP